MLAAIAAGISGWINLHQHFDPKVHHKNLQIATSAPARSTKTTGKGYTWVGLEKPGYTPSSPAQFISHFCPYAQLAAARIGIAPAAIIAQAALETGWGKHRGGHGYNLFGIKAGSSWTGRTVDLWTHEYENGKYVRVKAPFRDYLGFVGAWWNYSGLVGNLNRYQTAVADGTDWKAYLKDIQKAGYSTDPKYAQKLISIIEYHHIDKLCKP